MTLTTYLNSQFSAQQELDFFIRILVACLCGACIGFERSRRPERGGYPHACDRLLCRRAADDCLQIRLC